MDERGWWSSQVSPKWNTDKWTAWKVQNYNNPGMLDAICCFEGTAAFVETKWLKPGWPKRATTEVDVGLSPEQLRHFTDWLKSDGLGFVLLGVQDPRSWLLFDAHVFLDLEAKHLTPTRAELEGVSILHGAGWQSLADVPCFIRDYVPKDIRLVQPRS